MDVKVGDLVLVLHGSLLLDAEVKEAKSDDQAAEMRSKKLLVHYLVDLDRADEWVTQDRVLEDTPTSRELQTKGEDSSQSKSEASSASATFDKFCGPKRLDAIAAWMNTVDDALVRLGQDVKNVVRHQAEQADQLRELERRKKEAREEKAALEEAVLKELTRVKVAEETVLARKRLQNAGVSQDEIDAILPVIPRTRC
ncbi:hypothetical protein KRP22_015117 [Phytophthora ramorum]|nr:hypothetical protein KRP22_15050 [Phytophthora ramorum]